MRGKEYRHLARRTDVCSYCLCGQTIRKKLSKLLSSVERQSGYSLTVWNAARASALTLQLMVSSKGGLPASARPVLCHLSTNFDKVGSNGLGAFGSCPIPDVNFLFIFYFLLTGPKGDNDGC